MVVLEISFSLGLKSKAEILAVPTGLLVDVVGIKGKVWVLVKKNKRLVASD
jgi:hypothetical protein